MMKTTIKKVAKTKATTKKTTAISNEVARVNELYVLSTLNDAQGRLRMQVAILAVLRMGRELTRIREGCKHGEWGKLFGGEGKANVSEACFRFDVRTATNYMAAYRIFAERTVHLEDGFFFEGDDLEAVLCLDGRADALDEATLEARSIRQLYVNLGVIGGKGEAVDVENDGPTMENEELEGGLPGEAESGGGEAETEAAGASGSAAAGDRVREDGRSAYVTDREAAERNMSAIKREVELFVRGNLFTHLEPSERREVIEVLTEALETLKEIEGAEGDA